MVERERGKKTCCVCIHTKETSWRKRLDRDVLWKRQRQLLSREMNELWRVEVVKLHWTRRNGRSGWNVGEYLRNYTVERLTKFALLHPPTPTALHATFHSTLKIFAQSRSGSCQAVEWSTSKSWGCWRFCKTSNAPLIVRSSLGDGRPFDNSIRSRRWPRSLEAVKIVKPRLEGMSACWSTWTWIKSRVTGFDRLLLPSLEYDTQPPAPYG